MSLLLDTNVLSEWAAPKPDRAVLDWLNGLDEARVFISTVSAAEISRGIRLLPGGKRQASLQAWFEDRLLERFAGRCLVVDLPISLRWGTLMAETQRGGRALDAMDAFIAATASVHGMTLATRNTRHFSGCGIPLIDPWS